MMHRIVEAFTRPHDSVTAIDEIVQFLTVAPILALLFIVVFVVMWRLSR